jgi:hypothetical protein
VFCVCVVFVGVLCEQTEFTATSVGLLRPFFVVLVFSNGTPFFTVLTVRDKTCCDDVGIVRKL